MSHALFNLAGKVALITGGNGGIGLGFAQGVASSGADVAIWGTNAAKNAAAEAALAEHGTRVKSFVVDVGDEAAVNDGFAATLGHFGRVDGCFANAGVSGGWSRAGFHEMSAQEWDRVMRVNLDGVFYTFRAAAGHMVARGGGGVLVATSSMAAISGAAKAEHYGATKGAVISMVRAMAVEYARHGIRAHAVLPGWVETEMTEKTFATEPFHSNFMARIPMRRWGRPEDFAGIAVYMMSDASAWHTGESFLIDGGYMIF